MRNEDWIKWDLDSRSGIKMASFFADHGSAGYGFFLFIVEQLYRAENYKLEYDLIPVYAKLCKCMQSDAKIYIDHAIELQLMQADSTHFWSQRVLEEMAERREKSSDISRKRSEAAKQRWNNNNSLPKTANAKPCKPMQADANDARSDKIRSDKKRLDNTVRAEITYPPTLNTPECKIEWSRWLGHKAKRREAYKTEDSQEAQLRRCAKAMITPERFIAAIEFSIAQNYSGIFEEQKKTGSKQEQSTGVFGPNGFEYSESYLHNMGFFEEQKK